jgi:hypothetical protein
VYITITKKKRETQPKWKALKKFSGVDQTPGQKLLKRNKWFVVLSPTLSGSSKFVSSLKVEKSNNNNNNTFCLVIDFISGTLIIVTSRNSWPPRKITLGTISWHCVTAGFRRELDEICALLGYSAACSDDSLPKFHNNISSRVKDTWPLKTEPIGIS